MKVMVITLFGLANSAISMQLQNSLMRPFIEQELTPPHPRQGFFSNSLVSPTQSRNGTTDHTVDSKRTQQSPTQVSEPIIIRQLDDQPNTYCCGCDKKAFILGAVFCVLAGASLAVVLYIGSTN